MDLFTPQFAEQVHDFNLGIDGRGLFWTTMVPDNAVTVDLEAGTARFQMNNLPISDYQNFVNSVGDLTPPLPLIPSHVSFDVRWAAKSGAKLTRITDPTNTFTGEFIDSTASIRWSGRQPRFAFTSSSARATTVSGVIGREQNGRFFSS